MNLRKLMLVIGAGVVIGGSALAAPKAPPPQKVEVINTVQTSEVAKPEKPDPTKARCEPDDDLRTSELCAQWKAADAADRAANYTFWTLIIAVVSLAVTGASVWFIWESLRATREQQKQEFRGYLRISNENISINTKFLLSFEAHAHNYGRTPVDFGGKFICEVCWYEDERERSKTFETDLLSGAIVHPGQPKAIKISDPIDISEAIDLDQWLHYEVCTYFELDYADVFDGEHKVYGGDRFSVTFIKSGVRGVVLSIARRP